MTLAGNEPELQLGDSGEHVTELQDRLRGLGLLAKHPDGTYDDATETAVRQLQGTLGLDTDGRVTTETWQSLDAYMVNNGLHYNHYAGAGAQHWDVERAAAGEGSAGASAEQSTFDPSQHLVSDDGAYFWDGSAWQPHPAGGASDWATQETAADLTDPVGSVSPDGLWTWDGNQWQSRTQSAQ